MAVAFDLRQCRNHYFAEVPLQARSISERQVVKGVYHTWYSVFNVTTAASCARTIVSQARMTPSFVSVDSLSASSSRIKLPCNRYCEASQQQFRTSIGSRLKDYPTAGSALTMPKKYGIYERSGSSSNISSTACAAEIAFEVAARNDWEQIHILSSSKRATGSHFP